ncbi:MAG TPA: O-antigen ligase family protein, partial [Thermomicrobiales bacterium]|nr:O-antigen ligase family protein [Thermomicrobiales bacterium]
GLLALRRRIVIALALAPAAVLVLGLVVMTVAPTTLTGRLASIADEARPFDASSIPITPDNFAVVERMAHWQAGWHMFEDHPLTGVGIGNFNARYPDYFVRTEFRFSQGHAHNYYIHTLAETGIIGLIAYLTTATGFLVLAVIVALRSTDAMARFVALGSAGTMTAVYVHNVFENLHVLNLGILISVTWAMSVVAHRMWRRSDPDVADVHEID